MQVGSLSARGGRIWDNRGLMQSNKILAYKEPPARFPLECLFNRDRIVRKPVSRRQIVECVQILKPRCALQTVGLSR
jgi:hypothetical protein